MAPHPEPAYPNDDSLRWAWSVAGIATGAVLIALFIWIADPTFESPELALVITTLTVVLMGIVIGYKSPGETIRETAISGAVLLGLTAGGLTVSGHLTLSVPAILFLMLFYAPSLSMLGGWVGEMLQGTLDEAYTDIAMDWPWIVVGVVVGFLIHAYLVFVVDAVLGLTTPQLLLSFAVGAFVTGVIVGLHSPGITIVEPAIAAIGLAVMDAGLILLEIVVPASTAVAGIAVGLAIALALIGGWTGEMVQAARKGMPTLAAPSEGAAETAD